MGEWEIRLKKGPWIVDLQTDPSSVVKYAASGMRIYLSSVVHIEISAIVLVLSIVHQIYK